jgi:formamidopyrimidine-DNA glycosylase
MLAPGSEAVLSPLGQNVPVPELPEVQALADFLAERTAGLAVTGMELGSISVLKTFDPPPQALAGLPVDSVGRHGKFLDIDCDGIHLVFHLARAGWLRWSDAMPTTVLRPGKSPIALRARFSDGSGFDLTEAGTKKRLAAYIVRDPAEVPGVASLGPDPLADDFTREAFGAILEGKRAQIKGVLRDQSTIAGVGNAYSDEILHVAKMSPFAIASSLDEDAVDRLYAALRDTLKAAVGAASGKPAAELKDAKRAGMRVHGRTGETCPVCGDVVREVSFADSSLQYCATCQTGGKPLADRRMSRLLK